MRRVFIIEADEIPQDKFELIHRYIRKQLDPMNKMLHIHSVCLNTETDTFISTKQYRD